MGLAYFPTFRSEVPEVDASAVSGKLIAKEWETLNRIAGELKVTPLSDFVSVDSHEIATLTGENVDYVPESKWFQPSDALSSVRAITTLLTSSPERVSRADEVIADLASLEKALILAEKAQTEFRLTVDF